MWLQAYKEFHMLCGPAYVLLALKLGMPLRYDAQKRAPPQTLVWQLGSATN